MNLDFNKFNFSLCKDLTIPEQRQKRDLKWVLLDFQIFSRIEKIRFFIQVVKAQLEDSRTFGNTLRVLCRWAWTSNSICLEQQRCPWMDQELRISAIPEHIPSKSYQRPNAPSRWCFSLGEDEHKRLRPHQGDHSRHPQNVQNRAGEIQAEHFVATAATRDSLQVLQNSDWTDLWAVLANRAVQEDEADGRGRDRAEPLWEAPRVAQAYPRLSINPHRRHQASQLVLREIQSKS